MAILTIADSGATYTTLAAAYAAAATGDTLQYTGACTDTSSRVDIFLNNLTIDFNGQTVTFPSLTGSTHICRLQVANYSLTISGGGSGSVNTSGGLCNLNGNGGQTLTISDLVFNNTAASYSVYMVQTGYNNNTINITDCDFDSLYDDGAGCVQLNAASGCSSDLTISGTTFSNFYKAIVYTNGATTDANLSVTNCTFEEYANRGIEMEGGSLTVSGCTFLNSSDPYDSGRIAIEYGPLEGDTVTSSISTSTFTTNGINISYGLSGDVDQGSGGTISGNTFENDQSTYHIVVRTNNVTVSGNSLLGSANTLCHFIMVGSDSGGDIGSTSRAHNCAITGNTFTTEILPIADGTWNYHFIVIKADDCTITSNSFLFMDVPGYAVAAPNMTCVYPKGAGDCTVSGNTIHSAYDQLTVFRVADQGGIPVTDTVFQNNNIYGTIGKVIQVDFDNDVHDFCLTDNTLS